MHWAACCPPTGAQVTGETCLLRMLSGRAHVRGRIAGTGVGRGVRRCMSLMHARMVLVSFTCVPA